MTVTTVSNLDDRGPFSSPSKSLLYLDRFLTLSLDGSDAIVYGRNSDTQLVPTIAHLPNSESHDLSIN